MAKIILTTSDSGAGHIKRMRLADRVIAFQHRLVWGAVPRAADGAIFVAERRRMASEPGADWAYWLEWESEEKRDELGVEEQAVTEGLNPHWNDLIEIVSGFEVVELWADPLPNAQLILIQLLSWFAEHPTVLDKLTLVHARSPLGERGTGPFDDPRQSVGGSHVASALRAWGAYSSPTPEPWFGLASEAFNELPHLHDAVFSMLRELPDAKTGLGFTEALILGLLSEREAQPFDLFPGHRKRNQSTVFDYWETGLFIDRLPGGVEPAIAGLTVRRSASRPIVKIASG